MSLKVRLAFGWLIYSEVLAVGPAPAVVLEAGNDSADSHSQPWYETQIVSQSAEQSSAIYVWTLEESSSEACVYCTYTHFSSSTFFHCTRYDRSITKMVVIDAYKNRENIRIFCSADIKFSAYGKCQPVILLPNREVPSPLWLSQLLGGKTWEKRFMFII